jgi:hypothetical protein
MMDNNLSLMRAHRNNIARYRKLLKTSLTDLERQFVERRRGAVGYGEDRWFDLPSLVQDASFSQSQNANNHNAALARS